LSVGSILSAAEALRRRSAARPLAAAGATAGLLLAIAILAAVLSPLFHVRRIEVIGTDHLRRRDVIRLSDIDGGTNALLLDEGAVERRLLSQPWIASATVSRSLPSTVDIRIEERSAVGVVVRGRGYGLVAGDGTVLGEATSARGYPTVVPAPGSGGLAVPASVLAPMSASLRGVVAEVGMDGQGMVVLRLVSGILVVYGPPSEPAAKAEALEALLQWSEKEKAPLGYVDVRFPSAPTARLRGGGTVPL
jgi:cell division protein FtsQ